MNQNLRSYSIMRRMYENGMTYREIAKKIGVKDYTTVYNAMKRAAIRAGDPWPPQRTVKRQLNDNTVRADLVALEILEFCRENGWTQKQFAEAIGVAPSWIWNFTATKTRRKRMKRTSATKIMNFIMSYEEMAA